MDSPFLCFEIILGRVVKAVIPDADGKFPDLAWKIDPAFGLIRVKIPERLPEVGQSVSEYRPLGDIIMDLFRRHVVNELVVGLSANDFPNAVELSFLVDDIAQASLADPRIFPAGCVDPVHHHTRHRTHSIVPFPACLALNQAREEL